MKKLLAFIFACACLFGFSALGSETAAAAGQLNVIVPTERAVYQRNEKNRANMLVRVKYEADKKVTAILWNENNEVVSTEISLTATSDDAAIYEGTIPNVPAGGWYRMDVQAINPQTNEEETYVTIEKIGVGEVFITGGQSNSCSFGGTKTTAQEDMISAYDSKAGTWVHCEDPQPCVSGFSAGNGYGSPWPSAGDELYSQLNVPIGFITTGFGGSTVAELLEKHYDAILDAIQSLKPYGYRSFLFHQGEGDSGIGTKKDVYAQSLMQLIEKTREDAGYDLFWMVANAAYNPWTSIAANTEVLDGQKAVCNEEDIFLGPLTDDMLTGYRRTEDNLHFNEEGLKEHGRRWAEAIVTKMIPDYTQLPPEPSEAAPTSTPPVNSPVPTQPANTITPVPTNTNTPAQSSAPTEVKKTSNKGKVFKKGIFQYKITSDTKGKKKVKLTAIKSKNKKSIVIPKKVKYKGVTYQIASIDKTILKKLKKVKKIKVPSTIYKTCKTQLKGKKVVIKKF